MEHVSGKQYLRKCQYAAEPNIYYRATSVLPNRTFLLKNEETRVWNTTQAKHLSALNIKNTMW
jgi:hypothetical protein